MIRDRLYQVLLGPHISEKSTIGSELANQYTFKVTTDSNKKEIKQAVEALFEVTVTAVNVIKQKGKQKRFGRVMGKRSDWKKAIVTLAEGQSIDFTAVE